MIRSSGFRIFRAVMLLLFAGFFAFPLVAMVNFSTKIPATGERTWADWKLLVTDEALRESIVTSLELAVLTVVLMIVLLVPTMIWVRLRVPGPRAAHRVPVSAPAHDPGAGDRGRHQERDGVGQLLRR